MTYLNSFITHILLINIIACSNIETENKTITPVNNHTKDSIVNESKLNNPVLMNGSSFANYFQALYKLGRFEDMLLFTSKDLITKYGKERILESYKRMDFAYEIKLKSIQNNNDRTYTLNYSGVQFATNKIIRVLVISENDTVKLLKADFIKF